MKKKGGDVEKELYGSPNNLPTSDLPTLADIHRYIAKLLKEKLSKLDTIKKVQDELNTIWHNLVPNVPLMSELNVDSKIRRTFSIHCSANRNHVSSKQLAILKVKLEKLYDISGCVCKLTDEGCSGWSVRCTLKACPPLTHLLCKCPTLKKVILLMLLFYP
jgi:hypothetical protein